MQKYNIQRMQRHITPKKCGRYPHSVVIIIFEQKLEQVEKGKSKKESPLRIGSSDPRLYSFPFDQFDDEWKVVKNKLESIEQNGLRGDNQENVFNTLLSMKQLELEIKMHQKQITVKTQ